MKSKDILVETKKHLQSILEEKGLELFDIEFVKEVNNYYLRIFIDKENGVDINDCEYVSRAIDKVLDEKDYIEQGYILEVSSPGVDRPIRNKEEFEKYKGTLIEVRLFKAVNKQKQFIGTLESYIDDVITMSFEDETVLSFNRKDVAVCKLAVIF